MIYDDDEDDANDNFYVDANVELNMLSWWYANIHDDDDDASAIDAIFLLY